MPHQSAHEARGLILLAIKKLETPEGLAVHPGVHGHLQAARAQLEAACTLLTFSGADAPTEATEAAEAA